MVFAIYALSTVHNTELFISVPPPLSLDWITDYYVSYDLKYEWVLMMSLFLDGSN